MSDTTEATTTIEDTSESSAPERRPRPRRQRRRMRRLTRVVLALTVAAGILGGTVPGAAPDAASATTADSNPVVGLAHSHAGEGWGASPYSTFNGQWCAHFATKILADAGVSWLGYTASVQTVLDRARAAGRLVSRDAMPQPGDIAIFKSSNTSHVNIVVDVRADGTVRTIGGNEGSGSTYKQRRVVLSGWYNPKVSRSGSLAGYARSDIANVTTPVQVDPTGASSDVRADVNGDGFDDLVALYDGGNATSHLWVFPGSPGGLTAPANVWNSGVGHFDATRTKLSAGDVNGDGFSDLIANYSYDGAEMGVWVFPGSAAGLGGPSFVWGSGTGNWDSNRARYSAGDVNGDGYSDLVALYDGGNATSYLWVFRGGAAGLGAPILAWAGAPGQFDASRTKISMGDVNGDGFSDLVANYRYDGAAMGVWVFPGSVNFLGGPVYVWGSGGGNWDSNRARYSAGDVNGDGFSDLVALYDGGNATSHLWVFPGSPGGLTAPVNVWNSGVGHFDATRTKLSVGDVNGDGFSDLAALYGYDGAATGLWVFGGSSNGLVNPAYVWGSGLGNWDLNRTRIAM